MEMMFRDLLAGREHRPAPHRPHALSGTDPLDTRDRAARQRKALSLPLHQQHRLGDKACRHGSVILVPLPRFASIWISPCSSVTASRTTDMPTPRPEISVTAADVEKPGAKISWSQRVIIDAAACASVIRPFSSARARILVAVEPALHRPRPAHEDARRCRSIDRRTVRRLWLAQPLAAAGRLDAMADRIADQMHDRVLEPLQHPPVGRVVEALRNDIDVLALECRDVPRHFAKAAEYDTGRRQPDRLDAVPQIAKMTAKIADGAGMQRRRRRRSR